MNGLLVDPGDVAGLAAALVALGTHPALLDRLQVAAAPSVAGRFTVDHHVAAFERVLHQAAEPSCD